MASGRKPGRHPSLPPTQAERFSLPAFGSRGTELLRILKPSRREAAKELSCKAPFTVHLQQATFLTKRLL